MCEKTGQQLSGIDHVRQSLSRIILTLIGTRIQRRNFGSHLMRSVSAPGNDATKLKLAAIIASAILTWEPRVKLSHILFNVGVDGSCIIAVHCSYEGQTLKQDISMIGVAA